MNYQEFLNQYIEGREEEEHNPGQPLYIPYDIYTYYKSVAATA